MGKMPVGPTAKMAVLRPARLPSKLSGDLITSLYMDRQYRARPSPRRADAMCVGRVLFQHARPKLPADADMLVAPHRHLRRAIPLRGLPPTSSSHRDAPNRRGEYACYPPSRIYLWPRSATSSDQP